MPNVQRITDANNGGGIITLTPQTSVFANKLLVAVNGSIGTSHPPCPVVSNHCAGVWATIGGSPTVFAEGIPVNSTGNVDTCGHVRILGSLDVFVGF